MDKAKQDKLAKNQKRTLDGLPDCYKHTEEKERPEWDWIKRR